MSLVIVLCCLLIVLSLLGALSLALEGRKRSVNAWLRNANTNVTFRYHLYTNIAVVDDAITLATFTEATFPGYAAQNVAAAGWSAPVDDTHCATSQTGAPLVWTATGASAEFARGYYVTDTADGALLWAEPFVAAIDMTANGKTATLYAAYQHRTGAPC